MFENKEILLVEDNSASREIILRALERAHLEHHVRIVPDGTLALDYIHSRGAFADRNPRDPPVLVLLDLGLPGADGLQILRQLRLEASTRLIPVVIFSASQAESDILRSYEAGANGYVVKPVNYDEFTRVVGELGRYWLERNVPPSA